MRPNRQSTLLFTLTMSGALSVGCGESMDPPADGGLPDGSVEGPSLRTADVTYEVLYQAGTYDGFGVSGREWTPIDLSGAPNGELWIVQQMEREGTFDDDSECTTRGLMGGANDCAALQGSTVSIREPASLEPATAANGRATEIVDANALHFMRRPSGIAFGDPEIRVEPTDEGALDPATGAQLLTEAAVFTDTFATCHEHWTGNPTDMAPFIGPTLWTADPAIYDGTNGTEAWSNGKHLDMLHATEYCMGIAHERDNVYWLFNGERGAIDRYDFQAPHLPGHEYHGDGVISRYAFGDDALVRIPNVPSNMVVIGTDLYIADTGNGRLVRFDTTDPGVPFGPFFSGDGISSDLIDGVPLEPVATTETLTGLWGARVEPSGLAVLDSETLVLANHGSGHITLLGLDGAEIRTLDTGLGAGIGGLTVLDGAVYFAHMGERRVYRIDLVEAPIPPG